MADPMKSIRDECLHIAIDGEAVVLSGADVGEWREARRGDVFFAWRPDAHALVILNRGDVDIRVRFDDGGNYFAPKIEAVRGYFLCEKGKS